MSTFTPRLQLKRPDGSDPFKRQDFVDNWNKLDATPGTTVCLSTGRPTWGTAQAGMKIYQSDTRSEMVWSGTAWLPILTATSGWVLGVAPAVNLGKSAVVNYTLGTITTTRPGMFLMDLTAVLASQDAQPQSTSIHPYIGGAAMSYPSPGFIQWDGSSGSSSYNDYQTANTKGYKAVNPGTYQMQAHVIIGSLSTVTVHVYRILASIILINDQSR